MLVVTMYWVSIEYPLNVLIVTMYLYVNTARNVLLYISQKEVRTLVYFAPMLVVANIANLKEHKLI